MDNKRQEYFKQLRPPCVDLLTVALQFRSSRSNQREVLRALNATYDVLTKVAAQDGLDEELTEYAFMPLSHVFKQTQTLSLQCIEVALKCLQILVEKGWRHPLSPDLGKQLLILLTLLSGGTPAQNKGEQPRRSTSEDLDEATFVCIRSLCDALEGPLAAQTIFNEIGSATIIDQTVYILCEGVKGGGSDAVQRAAVSALRALCARITDRVVLARIMPGVISALTIVIKPSTQARRSFRLLEACLRLITDILEFCLNDNVALTDLKKKGSASEDEEGLGESWLKTTAAHIKIALFNVIQIRRHERQEVKDALMALCLMVVESCRQSLADSLPLMVETLIVLSEIDSQDSPNEAYSALRHVIITYDYVADIVKELLQTWITAFSRTMQSNDETGKQRAIRQISTAYRVLSDNQSDLQILDKSMASALCDSLTAIVSSSKSLPQPIPDSENFLSESKELHRRAQIKNFPPVLLEQKGQQQTLKDLNSMIDILNQTSSAGSITRLVMNQVGYEFHNSTLASFWLAVRFLKASTIRKSGLDEFMFINETHISSLVYSQRSLIEELYSFSLEILNKPQTDLPGDWRITALAVEAVAMQAEQLGEEFRPELIDALYPVLQVMASGNPNLRNHAVTCLNILTSACNYPDTSTMLVDNVDYLVNSVALKLNTFDVSPYPAQVLLMMVRLCGASLVPYLDDLVDSIFGIIDMYHGYPRLVELMFSTLAVIVEESVKEPRTLAIAGNLDTLTNKHRKRSFTPLPVVQLVMDLSERRKKVDDLERRNEERVVHPNRPWTDDLDGPPKQKEGFDDALKNLDAEETDEPLPPPRDQEDNEKPLSKPFSLLLHIVKSIPPHLSSPSPFLRRSLLSLLTKAIPVIARHESSLLPLISDIWPAVNARITSLDSLSTSSDYILDKSLATPTSLDLKNHSKSSEEGDQFDFHEEIFVIAAACSTISTISEYAGDFMASRVEQEFPRWRRLYLQVWGKVSADADRSSERRKLLHDKSSTEKAKLSAADRAATSRSQLLDFASGLSLIPATSSSLAPSTVGPSTARPFTAHHAVWRGLTSMFISFLLYIRLPLPVGDEICDFLGSWIVKFAGVDFYFDLKTRNRNTLPSSNSSAPSSKDLEIVHQAIAAMETWNKDLTWFIFTAQRSTIMRENGLGNGPREVYDTLQSIRLMEEVEFAVPVF